MNTNLTKLSPKKRKFVLYLKFLNFNKSNLSEIRKEIGIGKTTFYRWLKDKNLLRIVEESYIVGAQHAVPLIKESIHEVHTVLHKKALQGDISAIKLFLKIFDNSNKNINEEPTPDEIINLIRRIKKEKNEKISQN